MDFHDYLETALAALYNNAKWAAQSALPTTFRLGFATACSQCASLLRELDSASPDSTEAKLADTLAQSAETHFVAAMPDLESIYKVALYATSCGLDARVASLYQTLDDLLPNQWLPLRRASALLSRGDAVNAERLLLHYRTDRSEQTVARHALLGEARRAQGSPLWRESMQTVLVLATDAPTRDFAYHALSQR